MMCIIIDANVTGELFGHSISKDAEPVMRWLDDKGGRIVFGGRLANELIKNHRTRGWLVERVRAGRAIKVDDAILSKEENRLREQNICRSNDLHIIALARASGARVVFSRDKTLQHDFTNSSVLSGRRGKVYSSADHRTLLRYAQCEP